MLATFLWASIVLFFIFQILFLLIYFCLILHLQFYHSYRFSTFYILFSIVSYFTVKPVSFSMVISADSLIKVTNWLFGFSIIFPFPQNLESVIDSFPKFVDILSDFFLGIFQFLSILKSNLTEQAMIRCVSYIIFVSDEFTLNMFGCVSDYQVNYVYFVYGFGHY